MQHYSTISSNRFDAIAKRLDKIHILILDNSTHVTTLFKNMLSEFGFTSVYVANNGFHGVQILREAKINLIITDWDLKLPIATNESGTKVISHTDVLQFSGIEFVRRLRCSPSSPNPFIPVIMFLDAVEKIKVVNARDAGINEVCIKPLSADGLCKRIISVIDHPHIFITADNYKGPCRRRKVTTPIPNDINRREREVQIIKFNEYNRK